MRDLWFERAGWDAAHLLLVDVKPDKTLCARVAPGGWVEATFSAWQCGQCLARRRTRPDARVRQFVSGTNVGARQPSWPDVEIKPIEDRTLVDVHLPEEA